MATLQLKIDNIWGPETLGYDTEVTLAEVQVSTDGGATYLAAKVGYANSASHNPTSGDVTYLTDDLLTQEVTWATGRPRNLTIWLGYDVDDNFDLTVETLHIRFGAATTITHPIASARVEVSVMYGNFDIVVDPMIFTYFDAPSSSNSYGSWQEMPGFFQNSIGLPTRTLHADNLRIPLHVSKASGIDYYDLDSTGMTAFTPPENENGGHGRRLMYWLPMTLLSSTGDVKASGFLRSFSKLAAYRNNRIYLDSALAAVPFDAGDYLECRLRAYQADYGSARIMCADLPDRFTASSEQDVFVPADVGLVEIRYLDDNSINTVIHVPEVESWASVGMIHGPITLILADTNASTPAVNISGTGYDQLVWEAGAPAFDGVASAMIVTLLPFHTGVLPGIGTGYLGTWRLI